MAYRFDKTDNSIVIDGFERGISDDPFAGISDMRNVNIISVPREASVNFSTDTNTIAGIVRTVDSADTGADTVHISTGSSDMTAGMAVTFAGGSLPGGIVAGTVYWIGSIVSQQEFQLYTKPDVSGSAVDITSTGTGTMTSVDMGKPLYKAVYRPGGGATIRYFVIDANGRAWGTYASNKFVYMGNTTLTNAFGKGIVAYRGYLFVFRGSLIDYMSLTTFAWTYGWQTLNTASGTDNSHEALVGQDDTVYYCDDAYIGSFTQNSGSTFDPSNSTTYTWSQQALDLPSTETSQCLAELGTSLLVGGQTNAIYPWDRVSSSFSLPILLAENYMSRMKTVNTNTFILAGNRGRIYVTNGTQAQLYKKVPDHISGTVEPYFEWGDLDSSKNQLFFGLSAKTNAGVAFAGYGGLWAIDLDNKAIRLVNKLSYDTYNGVASVIIPLFTTPTSTATGTGLFIGWDSGASTYGVDQTVNEPYANNEATIDTDLIPIGTFHKPKQFRQVEFRLTKPMVSGESVILRYRLDFSQSYADIFTENTAGKFDGTSSVNFDAAKWVQFQIVLNSTNTTPSYTRLREIRIL